MPKGGAHRAGRGRGGGGSRGGAPARRARVAGHGVVLGNKGVVPGTAGLGIRRHAPIVMISGYGVGLGPGVADGGEDGRGSRQGDGASGGRVSPTLLDKVPSTTN